MSTATTSGLSHFLAQTDTVGMSLFIILMMMSVLSWSILAMKAWRLWTERTEARAFLSKFWRSTSLDEVHQDLAQNKPDNAFAELTWNAVQAQHHHAKCTAKSLAVAGSDQDYLTRTIKKTLDEVEARQEEGLTALATVAATAPFVGLFGTVWGVYHALAAIGLSGSSSLDKVAGPVGEALIMTGVGLAVAIPAVVGYNTLARHNRRVGAKLDSFAFELFTFLSTGHLLGHPARTGA